MRHEEHGALRRLGAEVREPHHPLELGRAPPLGIVDNAVQLNGSVQARKVEWRLATRPVAELLRRGRTGEGERQEQAEGYDGKRLSAHGGE